MFAVREEVEVLKEQIRELLEKNSQLEFENSILKQHATTETLGQLKQAATPALPDAAAAPPGASAVPGGPSGAVS